MQDNLKSVQTSLLNAGFAALRLDVANLRSRVLNVFTRSFAADCQCNLGSVKRAAGYVMPS